MLFALLWQSLALARVGSTVNVMADGEHAAMHLLEAGHHHADDGSYHLDDAFDSVQHVLTDHLAAPLALMAAAPHDVPMMGSAPPGGLHGAPVPDPFLEGLLRPPRSRS